jgi:hypothetical protein
VSDDDEPDKSSPVETLLKSAPVAFALGGAAVYGLLTIAYSKFYSELGVRPSEVGLEFGPGLGGIAGVTIVLVLLVGLLVLFLLINLGPYRLWVLVAVPVVVFVVLLAAMTAFANDQADRAKAGTPVEPFEVLGLEILSYRANLAQVELTDPKAAGSEAYKQLKDADRLMYLGRSGSSLVVYETGRQSAWHLPASSFAVRALNCETSRKDRDPDCP